jgi:hypothetical protein
MLMLQTVNTGHYWWRNAHKKGLPELRAAMTCTSSLNIRHKKSWTQAFGFNTAAALHTNAAVKGPSIMIWEAQRQR